MKFRLVIWFIKSRNWIELILLHLEAAWLRFKRLQVVTGKTLFLLIILLSIWTGLVIGQWIQNHNVRQEIAQVYLRGNDIEEQNRRLRAERRRLAEQLMDREAQIGIHQGKNRRRAQ